MTNDKTIKRRSTKANRLIAVAKAFEVRPELLRQHIKAGTLRAENRGRPGAVRPTYYVRPIDVDKVLSAKHIRPREPIALPIDDEPPIRRRLKNEVIHQYV